MKFNFKNSVLAVGMMAFGLISTGARAEAPDTLPIIGRAS